MPNVRIGLAVGADSVRVGATGEWTLTVEGGVTMDAAPAETWTVRSLGGGRTRAVNGTRTLDASTAIRVQVAAGGHLRIDDRPYRGDVLLVAGDSGITSVNTLGLEDYLLGVVPREIGRRPAGDVEAVKAQAVAARTYAIAHLGGRAGLGFDYFAGTQDQVYGGVADEDTVATRAVRETRGEIVTYRGVPILAYYSSTCGGRTAAIEDSWPDRTPVPYLVSVSDRIPGTDRYYCDASNRFRWSVHWTRQQLLNVLGETLRTYTATATLAGPSRIREMTMDRNASGRAILHLATDAARYTLRMDSIRWVLRTPVGAALNSSGLDAVETTEDSDGDVSGLTVSGHGWGHAIGMCQFGAIGRARAGQKHDQILRAYYTGTRVTRLY